MTSEKQSILGMEINAAQTLVAPRATNFGHVRHLTARGPPENRKTQHQHGGGDRGTNVSAFAAE